MHTGEKGLESALISLKAIPGEICRQGEFDLASN